MDNYLIRKAIFKDLEEIYLIQQQLKVNFCFLRQIEKEYIELKIIAGKIILLETDKIIACSNIEQDTSRKLSNILLLNTLVVREEFKNKGYGKILLNYILKECFSDIYNEIELGTFEEYGALEFYLKNGFKVKNIYNDIYNDNRKHKAFILSMKREEYGKM
jgi:GNAT superfamily N-acetyltransferase